MSRGGKRDNAGRKKGGKNRKRLVEVLQASSPKSVLMPETPLEYMLAVMRDRSAEYKRRDEMAKAAAPFCHEKLAPKENSKKQDRQQNAEKSASAGRFATSAAPKLAMH